MVRLARGACVRVAAYSAVGWAGLARDAVRRHEARTARHTRAAHQFEIGLALGARPAIVGARVAVRDGTVTRGTPRIRVRVVVVCVRVPFQ